VCTYTYIERVFSLLFFLHVFVRVNGRLSVSGFNVNKLKKDIYTFVTLYNKVLLVNNFS